MTKAKNTPATETPAVETPTQPDPLAIRQRREKLEVSRSVLVDVTGLPLSRVWAAETPGKDVTAEHLALITGALDEIEANGLPEKYQKAKAAVSALKHTQPTRAELAERLAKVYETLLTASDKKTIKELRDVIEEARRFASGEPNGEPAFQVVEATTDGATGEPSAA